MKRLMKFSTRRTIVLMLIVPTIGFIFILSTFYLYINKTKDDVLFTNIAGRQRMLSEQLGAYAHMVYDMGQEEDREPLQELVANYDSSLAVLDQGGEIMGRRLSPPPAEIQDEIDAVKKFWQDLKPALLLVADQPTTSTQAVKANNFIKVNIPRLRDLSNEVVFSFELLSHNQKERILWVLITILSLNFVLLLTGIVVIKRYLAERKKEEKALRESEEKYRNLFDTVEVGLYRSRLDGTAIVIVNQKISEITGKSEDEILSNPEFIHWENLEDREEMIRQLMQKGSLSDYEVHIVHKNGEIKTCLLSGKIFKEEGVFEGSLVDITERKQAERERSRLASFPELNPDPVIETDIAGNMTYLNPAARILFPDLRTGEPEHPILASIKSMISTFQRQGKKSLVLEMKLDNKVYEQHVSYIPESKRIRSYIVDITERKQAEEEVKKLSEVVEQSPDMAFITDPNGKIEYVNPAFTEITGYSAEDALGKDPKILKSGEMVKEFFQLVWSNILSGKPFHSEIINRKKNGELFIYDQTITPLKDADGNIINFISTGKDVTERVVTRKRLEEALVKAEQSDRVKTLFITNMSHEIRTPINGVIGFVDLVKHQLGDQADETVNKYFEYIDVSAQRIMKTVNSILDFSQIEAGTLPITNMELNLEEIIKSLVEEQSFNAQEKGLALNFYSRVREPVIIADEYRVTSAISNLIDNAIKYTDKGSVSIEIQRKGKKIWTTITDTGIGMSEEFLSRIYEPYSQESEGYSKKYQGIGLGLALTKRCLDTIGAEIDVMSKKGAGTTFTVAFGV